MSLHSKTIDFHRNLTFSHINCCLAKIDKEPMKYAYSLLLSKNNPTVFITSISDLINNID